MKTFNVDEYLQQNGVKIIIKGKEYVVRDIPSELPENGDNVEFLSRVIGCPKEDLQSYGVASLLKIYDFLYENLIPKNFQNPPSGG